MFEQLAFAYPWLLYGAGAAALPFLLHLLLRPRPQRLRFPALALLRPALLSGKRSSRIRNFWLLLVRAALLAGVAALLAGPTCRAPAADASGSAPIACVLLLDDSLSTRYPLDVEHRIDEALARRAAELVSAARDWPASSVAAVLRLSHQESAEWSDSWDALLTRMRSAGPPPPHARTLGDGVRRAGLMLRSTDQPARRLVIFTDGAAHAWRDVNAADLAHISGLVVEVIAPVRLARSNLSLAVPVLPRHAYPPDAEVPLHLTLAAQGAAAECRVTVLGENGELARAEPPSIAAGSTHSMDLPLPAQPAGLHSLTVVLEPNDWLSFDQARACALRIGERPFVWLVSDAAGESHDLVPLLLANLLAPTGLPAAQQLVRLKRVAPADVPTADESVPDVARPALVVWLPTEVTAASEWPRLLALARQGTTLLIVPRSPDAITAEAQWWRMLCETPPPVEDLESPQHIRFTPRARLTPPRPADDEFARCAVRRRWHCEPADAVQVVAQYDDGLPAVLARPIDAGELLLLTTSPSPEWSEHGLRAAGLITWLHALVDDAAGQADQVAHFVVGEPSRRRFQGLPENGPVRLTHHSGRGSSAVWMAMRGGEPEHPWPTGEPGVYLLRPAGGASDVAVYDVNWPEAESDLTLISTEELRAATGLPVRLTDLAASEPSGSGSWLAALRSTDDLRGALAFTLVILLLLETALSRRRPKPAEKRPRAIQETETT